MSDGLIGAGSNCVRCGGRGWVYEEGAAPLVATACECPAGEARAALTMADQLSRRLADAQSAHAEVRQLLAKLASEGGCLVSSADCSVVEIADARARGDFWVDGDGLGFVRRLPEWLRLHSDCARGTTTGAG